MFLTIIYLVCLILILYGVSASEYISSKDEVSMKLLSREDAPLWAEPATVYLHRLQLQIHNKGYEGIFDITHGPTTGSDKETVHGELTASGLSDKQISIGTNEMKTVTLSKIQFPNVSRGTRVDTTITIKKTNTLLGQPKIEASLAIEFIVGYSSEEDTTKPDLEKDQPSSCPVLRNSTRCRDYLWQWYFTVQDIDSGLKSVLVQTVGKDLHKGSLSYEYRNFVIGTRDKQNINGQVSCCVAGVQVTAEDLVGTKADMVSLLGDSGSTTSKANVVIVFITTLTVISLKLLMG
jgi:hypothetical protein